MAPPSRREFIKQSAASLAIVGSPDERTDHIFPSPPDTPWYRRTYRWAQTNISEIDPTQYDIAWWRKQWKRTCVQGVIINAGGIVAFYPTKIPLHHRAEFLGDRDLYG